MIKASDYEDGYPIFRGGGASIRKSHATAAY